MLAILIYIVVTLLNFADYVWGQVLFTSLKYVVLTFFPVLLVPIVCFANLICLVYEKPKNAKYIREARQKLSASGATVVGITGSYGKTSAKNILSHLLDGDYKVLSTPRSYNTPLGIARALNESEEEFNLFIAEMGARHVGDIEELCSDAHGFGAHDAFVDSAHKLLFVIQKYTAVFEIFCGGDHLLVYRRDLLFAARRVQADAPRLDMIDGKNRAHQYHEQHKTA